MEDVRSDKQIVEELKQGNQASLEVLINRYGTKVYSLAMRFTRCPEDAEEVLQDVFLTVCRKINSFEGKSAFSSWLFRVTVNSSLMKMRKRKSSRMVALEDVQEHVRDRWICEKTEQNPADLETYRGEVRKHLTKEIAQLPDEYRPVFVLRDVDGMSNKEVGSILGLSIPAVKSRLHRARIMLRRNLRNVYEEESSDSVAPASNG